MIVLLPCLSFPIVSTSNTIAFADRVVAESRVTERVVFQKETLVIAFSSRTEYKIVQ